MHQNAPFFTQRSKITTDLSYYVALTRISNTEHVWQYQFFSIKGNQYLYTVLIPVLGSMMLLVTNSESVCLIYDFAVEKCNT